MCGIAGWYTWGNARPTGRLVKAMLLANQTRGMDAAGVAYYNAEANRIRIRKDPGSAAQFVRSQSEDFWEEVSQSPVGLLHARAVSKGTEKDNENNHPVTGFGWVVVHNGHVSNDDSLWDHYKEKRFAEVDTSAIPLVLSRGGDNYINSLEHLCLLGGAVTTAIWSDKEVSRVALARLGSNDLYLFVDQNRQILYWSSAAIVGRIMPSTAVGPLKFLSMHKLPESRVLLLDQEQPFHAELFKVERHPFVIARTRTPTTTTSDNRVSKNESRATLKWERSGEEAKKWQFKPSPMLPRPALFSWDSGSLRETHERMVKESLDSCTIPSAYGRWVIVRTDKAFIRHFKPIKSFKKWLRRNVGVGRQYPVMPVAVNSEDFQQYDGVMRTELLQFRSPTGGNGWCSEPGELCPWCGMWAQTRLWYTRNQCCEWCGIRSHYPVMTGTSVTRVVEEK